MSWEEVKERLERYLREWPDCPLDERFDIRSALQRVEELELERDSARELFLEADAAQNEVVALRQRVEELERQRVEGVVALCVCENAATPRPDCDCVTCTVKRADQRAEAAEARVEQLWAKLNEQKLITASYATDAGQMQKERDEAQAKLARVVEAGDALLDRIKRHQVHGIYQEDHVAVEAWLAAAKGE